MGILKIFGSIQIDIDRLMDENGRKMKAHLFSQFK